MAKLEIPKSLRYDPSNVLGSNCAINLVTGARSFGKTYAFKKQAIKKYIKEGKTWSYVRYTDITLERMLKEKDFLLDITINDEFPDYKFKTDSRRLYIAEKGEHTRWEEFGAMYSLTTFNSYKGSTSPLMWLMFLDEFINEDPATPYPRGCVNKFYSMWETFDRREDRVTCVLAANVADCTNPFFREFGIRPIPKGTFRKFKHGKSYVFYENAFNPDFRNLASQSNIGKLTAGTDYDRYALDNEFLSETGEFVRRKLKDDIPVMRIVWDDYNFTLFSNDHVQTILVTTRASNVVLSEADTFVLTKDNMQVDYYLLDRCSGIIKFLFNKFQTGRLWFNSDQCREAFKEVLGFCGMR